MIHQVLNAAQVHYYNGDTAYSKGRVKHDIRIDIHAADLVKHDIRIDIHAAATVKHDILLAVRQGDRFTN